MDSHNVLSKEASRIRKPERPYISLLKSSTTETRRRPLRTYSKRTSSTESTEPAPKRRCLTGSSTTPIRDAEADLVPRGPGHSATALAPQPSPSRPPTKKGTITAYFGKIIPQPPVVTPSSDPPSDLLLESNDPTITPPSSPPIIITRNRRARRLKTRVVTQQAGEKEGDGEEHENEDSEKGVGRIRDIEPPARARPPALLEATPNALNQGKDVCRIQPESGKPRGNGRRRNKTAPVQTTLSLSLSEAQYTECKECDMLYNHLHEADVKYHARRHAALRRARARTNTKGDVAE